MTITVYGASDDLIEVEGDICEEFNPPLEDTQALIAVSDGTLLRVVYDKDGLWRINRIAEGSAAYSKVEAGPPDSKDYSDRVTLIGEIRWVAMASSWAGPSK